MAILETSMKKILLLIVLTAGSVAHAQTSQSNAPGKVGYADVEYIISQLPEMKELESDMKSTQTQLRNQIQAKSQQVQKQYTDFNANAQSMHDTVRVNKQRELETAMNDLEQMQQDAQRTLQNKQKLFMAPLILKVNKAIQDVAKENGFSMIISNKVSSYDVLTFKSEAFDISNLVLQKFGVTPKPNPK